MALTLIQAHGLVMILSIVCFGSMGIFMARYGRSLRFGSRRQFLGKAFWFQIHRFLLSISSVLILIGFFLILVYANGGWVNPNLQGLRLFGHSICGGIIVCCSVIQIWLALYRCHPQSRFRFIFDWSHRIVGLSILTLSIPTLFLIVSQWKKNRNALIAIVSIWVGWIFTVAVIGERVDRKQRIFAATATNTAPQSDTNQANMQTNTRHDTEAGTIMNIGNRFHNQVKLLLYFIHIFMSITLSILLIVFISI